MASSSIPSCLYTTKVCVPLLRQPHLPGRQLVAFCNFLSRTRYLRWSVKDKIEREVVDCWQHFLSLVFFYLSSTVQTQLCKGLRRNWICSCSIVPFQQFFFYDNFQLNFLYELSSSISSLSFLHHTIQYDRKYNRILLPWIQMIAILLYIIIGRCFFIEGFDKLHWFLSPSSRYYLSSPHMNIFSSQ